MARAAEEVGFDTIWLGDHLRYRYEDGSSRGPWEVWTMLAALAASTSRIRLGPLVAATAFHAPAMLAKLAATVDEVSGGRLIVGLGAGWNETEFRAFGFPFDHRISRFEEAFTIIRTLLREGRIDFEGEFYQARDCELLPPPARPGGPPLMVGSVGPRMLEITLPHVEQWNVWYRQSNNTPAGLEPILRQVDEACRAVGRDPSTLEKTSAVLVGMPAGSGRTTMYDEGAVAPLSGSTADIAAGLRAYADLGLAEVQLVVDPITEGSIRALEEVLAELDR
jgi:alkanesulfonate monooxygenase SsuD/methylene tetrahydromethanopterin reductase-like flavin-dependent oxidoreductase (luciferase family)